MSDDMRRAVNAVFKKAFIYARVSTDNQEDNTSFEEQTENCMDRAIELGIQIVDIYKEVFTGSLYRERKNLSEMRARFKNHEANVLLINTFDRLSRNQTHFAVLMDELEALGVEVIAIKEKIDDTPEGKFMLAAKSFMAEKEREKTSERTSAGRKRRVSQGRLNPGAKAPYGYRFDDPAYRKKNTYVVYEPDAIIVRRIYNLYKKGGISLRAIARMLHEEGIATPTGRGTWSERTVHLILKSIVYTGKASSFKWDSNRDRAGKYHSRLRPVEEWVFLEVPRIISDEDFEAVQKRLQLNKQYSARNNPDPEGSLLRAGFIKCGYCGRYLSPHKRTKNNPRYQCNAHYRSISTCKGTVIAVKVIDDIVWKYIGEVIADFTLVEQALQLIRKQGDSTVNDLSSIENSIKIAKSQIKQFGEDLAETDSEGKFKLKGAGRSFVLDQMSQKETYISDLEQEKKKIQSGQLSWKQIQEEIEMFTKWCLNARTTYPTATYEEKRRALRMFGIEVFVYQEQDMEHKRYDIKVKVPHIALHSSWTMYHNSAFFFVGRDPENWYINPVLTQNTTGGML